MSRAGCGGRSRASAGHGRSRRLRSVKPRQRTHFYKDQPCARFRRRARQLRTRNVGLIVLFHSIRRHHRFGDGLRFGLQNIVRVLAFAGALLLVFALEGASAASMHASHAGHGRAMSATIVTVTARAAELPDRGVIKSGAGAVHATAEAETCCDPAGSHPADHSRDGGCDGLACASAPIGLDFLSWPAAPARRSHGVGNAAASILTPHERMPEPRPPRA